MCRAALPSAGPAEGKAGGSGSQELPLCLSTDVWEAASARGLLNSEAAPLFLFILLPLMTR